MICTDHLQVKSNPLFHNLLIPQITRKSARDFLIIQIKNKQTNRQTAVKTVPTWSGHKSSKGERD